MYRKILVLLIVSFTVATQSLLALGLGEIKLKSSLNQPLDAEITLVYVRSESNDQLKAKLGSEIEFTRVGIERTFFLNKIRFETITKANGQKVIHLTTKDIVKEPFLNFLVDLDWPNGKLLREYTLLLDPPVFDEAPAPKVQPASQVRKSTPKVKARNQSNPSKGDVYGPTSGEDTLWKIAAKTRPNRSISMNQAMITLFEANPSAFMKGNINNLKRGVTLQIPTDDEFSQYSQREAMNMISQHNKNWKSGKVMPPRAVMDTSSNNGTNSNKRTDFNDSGRLSLSTSSEKTGTAGSTSTDIFVEEQNEVLKQQNESLETQAQSDSQRIEQLERLLELKNEQLASIQNRDKVTEEPTTNTSEDTPATENTNAVVTKTEPLDDMTPTAMPKPKTITDEFLAGNYNLYLGLLGLTVILLLLISIIRRRNNDTSYQDAVAASKPVKRESPLAASVIADELPESADQVLSEENDIPLQAEDNSIEPTEKSDPLGEADIYIAYGKFEQAESLLLSAISDTPEREELTVKLLECYAEMNNEENFTNLVNNTSLDLESDSELFTNIEDLYSATWPTGEFFSDEQNTESDVTNEAPTEEFSFEDDTAQNDDDIESNIDGLPSTEDVFGEADFDDELTESINDSEQLESAEIENNDSADNDDSDDIDTQLDLARAYVEMGDFEGTREIISEIIESGSEKQKVQAQEILDSIND